jgi:ABC-2 type transport system permease protein
MNYLRQGTHELLLTHPLSSLQLLVGKFLFYGLLGVLFMIIVLLLLPLLLYKDTVYLPLFLLQSLSFFLFTLSCFSVAIFTSVRYKSPMLAALIALSLLLLSLFISYLSPLLSTAWLRELLSIFNMFEHYRLLLSGVLEIKSLLFFPFLTLLFLAMSLQHLDSEDWKQN